VHFALVDGTASSPALGIYSMEGLNTELDLAGRHFCQREVVVSASSRTVILPRVFKWYGQDIGKDRIEISKFVAPYLESSQRSDLLALVQSGSPKIKYKEYDWQLFLRPARVSLVGR